MPQRIRSGIPGISRTSLWNSWKQIRQELRHSRLRDVVDHFEYDLDPEVWIRRLVRDLASGTYEPTTPTRFTLAKGKGFSRRMTLPSVPDLVLYRAIAHHCYQRALRKEREHVYFERGKLAQIREAVQREATAAAQSPYTGFRRRRFFAWLRYDQYRKYLIFKKIYPYIVVSDVTNFFDSTQYQRISDALAGIASAKMLGLLVFLLERLSIRDAYSGSPLVGLPVDEFDCSRALAHLVLFPHDERMVERVGEAAYVRWMDDQNIGVDSRASGLETLALVGGSLARLHLTANSGKSRILTLSEARRHFHLDLNGVLDRLESAPRSTSAERRRFNTNLRRLWRRARAHEGKGEWEKILKRTYRLAGITGGRWLRVRVLRDVLAYPDMIERIADYVRMTGTPSEYVAFAERLWSHPEQIYPDVNVAVFERLLLLHPAGDDRKRLRAVASAVLRGEAQWAGCTQCQAIAPLLVLRYGDGRSVRTLLTRVEQQADRLEPAAIKASALVLASYGKAHFRVVRRTAARMLRGELSEAVRLIERIIEFEVVPERFSSRLEPIWDAVARRHRLDMRRVLSARLLLQNERPVVRTWVNTKLTKLSSMKTLDDWERRLLNRLFTH